MTGRRIPAPPGLTEVRSARLRIAEAVLRLDLERRHDARPLLITAQRELNAAESLLLREASDHD